MKPLLLFAALLFLALDSRPQSDTLQLSTEKAFNYDITLGSAIYGGGERYELASAYAQLECNARYSLKSAYAFVDLRLLNGVFFDEDVNRGEIREAFAGLKTRKLDFSLGKKIISWGRTDGFNPTNNVCAQNYFFLSPEPDDQRMGNFMAHLRWRLFPQAELELLAMPFYQASIYRYELFDMGSQAAFADPVLPERRIKNGTVAARYTMELRSFGFSASYFNGFDPFYGFRVGEIELFPNVLITNTPAYYRKQSLGADFALPISSWILRAEGAWDITKNYADTMQIPNPSLNYVLALERDILGVTCILQYIGKHTLDFRRISEPVLTDSTSMLAQIQYALAMIDYESTRFNRLIHHQQEPFNHALFLALRKTFAHEVLESELSMYYNISSEEFLIRPQIQWHATDALSCKLGASWMWGKEDEIFDRAGKVLNAVFLGMYVKF